MKKFLPLILIASVAAGCSDRQAAQNAQVREAHQEVALLLNDAQLSYVPGDNSSTYSKAQWRQTKQQEAQKKLQEILTEGTPSQQIATRRMSADIYDSAARNKIAAATAQWAELSNQSALLLSYLQAVDRADAELRRFSSDHTKIIANMRSIAQDMQKNSDGFKQELTTWQNTAKDLAGKIESLEAQNQKLVNQVADLRVTAFAQKGLERYQTYEKASLIAIEGNKISSELQKLKAQHEIATSHVAVSAQQLKLADEAVAQAQTQLKAMIATEADQAKLKTKSQEVKAASIEKLNAELGKIATQYSQLKDETFAPCEVDVNKALELLNGTLALAKDPTDRRQVQLDLLARNLSKLNLLSLEASAAGDWARKMHVIASTASDEKRPGGQLIPQSTEFYESTAKAADQWVAKIIAEAEKTTSDATELATALTQGGSDSDPIAKNAAKLAGLMDGYTATINASKK